MQTVAESDVIISKTRELCQAVLDQPATQRLRLQMDAFLADEGAKQQFQTVMEKGENLHQKQHAGMTLSNEEIADYEKHRELLMNNPVARGFLEAREEISRVQDSVGKYLNKMWELGRVPEVSDMDEGSCGHGCGCHH